MIELQNKIKITSYQVLGSFQGWQNIKNVSHKLNVLDLVDVDKEKYSKLFSPYRNDWWYESDNYDLVFKIQSIGNHSNFYEKIENDNKNKNNNTITSYSWSPGIVRFSSIQTWH